ncbi:MAG: hypothetical protein KOO60_08530 [Gemmatimonadales bacterium]|nr:hypothetical protein [Gemmatimonadales bacterium]
MPLEAKPNPFTGAAKVLGALLLPLAILGGCHPSPPVGPGIPQGPVEPVLWPGPDNELNVQRENCDPLAGEAVPGGTFLFALTDSVLPRRAPVPHNPSERIVFAQLYETLVSLDCSGYLSPGLAEQWVCTQDSTVWVFTIRQDARFWDGSRINSGDIKKAWCDNQTCAGDRELVTPWAWLNARAGTISVLDARRLAIRLPEPQADFPALMTHPATAISVRRPGWIWPVGSGPSRLRASTPPPLPDLECKPNPQHPLAPIWKKLTFLVQPESDPRDLISLDFHLAQVKDLESVRFFAEARDFTVTPLPWNRLYLLVCSLAGNPQGTRRWLDPAHQLDPDRELTRVAARGWPGIILPAGEGSTCPQITGPITINDSARLDWGLDNILLDENTLVYDVKDPGARELAQRLAALGDAQIRTTGIPLAAVNFTLQWQMAGSYILPMDLEFPTTCLQLASLMGRASWLQEAALTGGGNPERNLVTRGLVYPLALTHPWLVSRGELTGLRLAFDGTPLLSQIGKPAPQEVSP